MKFSMCFVLACMVGFLACSSNNIFHKIDAAQVFKITSNDAGVDVLHDSGTDTLLRADAHDSSLHDVGTDSKTDSKTDSVSDALIDVSLQDAIVDVQTSMDVATCPLPAILNEWGIAYNGGPVMLNQPTVYFIWYGDWSGNTATTILPKLMTDLAAGNDPVGTSFLGISSTYYSLQPYPACTQQFLSGKIQFGGSWFVPNPSNLNLSDEDLQTIVVSTVQANQAQLDTNAIYFMISCQENHQPRAGG